jgi:nucleoid-associated protein YgaU
MQRELVIREEIALEQVKIENLKQDIQTCSEKVDGAKKKKLTLLGTDEQGYLAVCSTLDNILFQLQTFSSAGISDMVQNQQIIDSLFNSSDNLKKTTRYVRVDSLAAKMRAIEEIHNKLANAVNEYLKKSSVPLSTENTDTILTKQLPDSNEIHRIPSDGLVDSWTVSSEEGKKRESLFKIAGYPQVYGDPYQWKKIYSANKELIDNNYKRYQKLQSADASINPQDVIFPGQVLKIPR